MGNKLGRRRQLVEDKYTRPQGLLYQPKDLDHKKLRKLILDSKLAPCYPGRDDTAASDDLEECPICFLCYPSLNRSRCCMKGICTECFLQMKTPKSTRPTQCPFCKTSNYAVEYRGVKTMEEKVMEQIEEQWMIEANIRMRQQERKDEEEKMQKRQDINSLSRITRSGEIEYSSIAEPMEVDEIVSNLQSSAMEVDEIVSIQHPSTASSIRQPRRSRQNRYPIRPLQSRQNREGFDLNLEDIVINLEDIMVLQAIWLSIQEEGRHNYEDAPFGQHVSSEDRSISSAAMAPRPPPAETASSSSSPYGGLACAIAALGEHQQVGGTTVAWQ